nr:unnamed protein product [Callosobruchus analis]
MEWTNELTLEFLSLFKNEPVAWSPRIPDHKNRNKMADVWTIIQKQFSVECSVAELKKKKESLMTMFRQLLNKVKSSLKSGAGQAFVVCLRNHGKLFAARLFCKGYYKYRESDVTGSRNKYYLRYSVGVGNNNWVFYSTKVSTNHGHAHDFSIFGCFGSVLMRALY